MKFARGVWRLLVGIKDGMVLIFMLLFFGALFAVLTSRPSPAQVRDGALLLQLDGSVVEESTPIDPLQALLASEAPVREYQARDLVRAIDAAATDDRITAVVLDLDRFLGGGQVHLQAIGDALARVRAADKPVLAYATAYHDDSILLAANASEIWMDPLGGAMIAGPGGQQPYFAGLLDRLNINARVYRVGTYKSAVEPWTRDSMSEESRENYTALYGVLWEEWQAHVKAARPALKLDTIIGDQVGWVAAANGDLGRAAVSAGLVDKLGSKVEFDAHVVELVGADDWSDALNAYPSTGYDAWLSDLGDETADQSIGVITVAGEIVDGDAGPGSAGGTRIAQLLDDALDDDLKALVVRVDSPGGSVLASEEIRRAIERHKARGIPVAVSMGNVAASGGYWVSMPADRIFAEPETITGSIGIFAVIPTFEGLAADWGVNFDGVRSTPLSGQPDLLSGFTPEVDAILQASIEDRYRDFLTRVARSRKLSVPAVDRIAQGRVWDGGSARQIGLVDQYGGLEDALAWAAEQAELGEGDWAPVFLGEEAGGAYDTLLRQWVFGDEETARPDMAGMFARREADASARLVADLDRLLSMQGTQALCLECPAQSRAPARRTFDGWAGWIASVFAR